MSWYLTVVQKYAVFSGRARRMEYWMFVLVNSLISIALMACEFAVARQAPTLSFLSAIYALAMLLPSLGVSVRRLHDTGRSGWWLLIGLIPLLGAIVLLVFFASDGTPGDNQYGPNPKSVGAPAFA